MIYSRPSVICPPRIDSKPQTFYTSNEPRTFCTDREPLTFCNEPPTPPYTDSEPSTSPFTDGEPPTLPYSSLLQHKGLLQSKNTMLEGFGDYVDHRGLPSPYPPYYYQQSNSSNCTDTSFLNSYPKWSEIPTPHSYDQELIVKTLGKYYYNESPYPPTPIINKHFSYQQHTFQPPRKRPSSKRPYPKTNSSSKIGSITHLPKPLQTKR